MRNIVYDSEYGMELPMEIQLQRIQRVMDCELTEVQRKDLMAYYFEELTPSKIARRRGVYPSTVVRSIRRAEERLRKFLTY